MAAAAVFGGGLSLLAEAPAGSTPPRDTCGTHLRDRCDVLVGRSVRCTAASNRGGRRGAWGGSTRSGVGLVVGAARGCPCLAWTLTVSWLDSRSDEGPHSACAPSNPARHRNTTSRWPSVA